MEVDIYNGVFVRHSVRMPSVFMAVLDDILISNNLYLPLSDVFSL